MISKLREETTQLHKEIEKDNLAGLIMNHSITLDQYKTLLLQNYISYKVAEKSIQAFLKDFDTSKSDQLLKDLHSLNVDPLVLKEFEDSISCNNRVEALGAAYVLEGSVLGGMMIAKELKECKELAEIKTHYFFNGDRSNVSGWKKFLKLVNSEEFSEAEKMQAANKAKDTFKFFGNVFSNVGIHNLESQQQL